MDNGKGACEKMSESFFTGLFIKFSQSLVEQQKNRIRMRFLSVEHREIEVEHSFVFLLVNTALRLTTNGFTSR